MPSYYISISAYIHPVLSYDDIYKFSGDSFKIQIGTAQLLFKLLIRALPRTVRKSIEHYMYLHHLFLCIGIISLSSIWLQHALYVAYGTAGKEVTSVKSSKSHYSSNINHSLIETVPSDTY